MVSPPPTEPSTPRRQFLGRAKPALPVAAGRLAERYRQGPMLDLGRVIVVVPGQRAGRRLQELLAFLAEDEKLRLTPPEVVTEGRLPEMLYTPKLPFATDLVQDLAWAQTLRNVPKDKQKEMIAQLELRPSSPFKALRFLWQPIPIKLDFHNLSTRRILDLIRSAPEVPCHPDVLVLIGHTKEHLDDRRFEQLLEAIAKESSLKIISFASLAQTLLTPLHNENRVAVG